jgi:hypothetical protein
VPRNAAFVFRAQLGADPDPVAVAKNIETDAEILGNSVLTSEDGDVRIVKLEADLEPGTTFSTWQWGTFVGAYQASDVVDSEPPNAPGLDGGSVKFHDGETTCVQDSCGDYTVMKLDITPPQDDHAAAEQLVYAVYVGETARQAQAAQAPLAILTTIMPGELLTFVSANFDERDVFVTVSAIDMAGNESVRSEARQVNSAPSSGCGAARSRANLFAALPIAALLAWLFRKKRRAPFSRSTC